MSGKDKKPRTPERKQPKKRDADDLYDDGDIATPKRNVSEDEIKEQEDKRM